MDLEYLCGVSWLACENEMHARSLQPFNTLCLMRWDAPVNQTLILTRRGLQTVTYSGLKKYSDNLATLKLCIALGNKIELLKFYMR